MLSFLACKFPIFNANDDIEALMELAAILGKRKMEKCAQLHSKEFCMVNIYLKLYRLTNFQIEPLRLMCPQSTTQA